jgi:DNA-binding NarL/FixJ family response regulator
MSKIRILIADNHVVVREGLRALIHREPDMEVVGEAGDGQETLKQAKKLRPDIVLLDISMPRLSGLDVIERIRAAVETARIVILSMYKNEPYIHQALASGAMGYVLKHSSSSEVIMAIREVSQGKYFLTPQINAKLIVRYFKNKRPAPVFGKYDLLSDREQQVFRLIVEGNTTAEIATLLGISPKTIEKHRSNLMVKLDLPNIVALVKYAISIGIIDTTND